MFLKLNIRNLYALSSASPYEDAWMYYCDGEIDGEYMDVCISGLFDSLWMEDSEAKDIAKETL